MTTNQPYLLHIQNLRRLESMLAKASVLATLFAIEGIDEAACFARTAAHAAMELRPEMRA